MICWLASYPRSGNTLFRILVHRFFGVGTWSRHGDGNVHDIGAHLSDVVGFVPHGALDEAKLHEMAAGDGLALVKTHDLPPTDNAFPAICIVRDGRSAVTSYWHYRNRPGDVGATLGDVLAGRVMFGSWSDHVAAWLDAPLPRRLVIRYEALVTDPVATMQAVGTFLGWTPLDATPPGFTELHARAPHHFRSGSDAANVAELEARCPALFNSLHGHLQSRLGYPPARVDGGMPAALMQEIRASLAEAERRAHTDAEDKARADAETRSRADAAAFQAREAQLHRQIADLKAQNDAATLEIQDLTQGLGKAQATISAMRLSPFWRARDATVDLLRTTRLRRG